MGSFRNYQVITVTHQTLDINDIAKFYLADSGQDIKIGLQRIKDVCNIDECIYLETCNRVSYILYSKNQTETLELSRFFRTVNPDFDIALIHNKTEVVSQYSGIEAINHILRVVSSIESVVIGERQILSQFRKAYEQCRLAGFCKDNMRLLHIAAISTAKKVYSHTRIGEKPLSVVSLAINRLRSMGANHLDKVALVGAGKTNMLVAKFLKKLNFEKITVYNRNIEKGAKLSESFNTVTKPLSDLVNIKGEFDIVFICTSANKVLIDEAIYDKMLDGQSSNKVFIDLAVPRNVDPEIVSKYNVTYIDIASLKKEADQNLQFRQQEIEAAENIISKQLQEFKQLYHERQIELSLSLLPAELQAIKKNAVDTVFKERLESLTPFAKSLAEDMLSYIEKKYIALPMKLAKSTLS